MFESAFLVHYNCTLGIMADVRHGGGVLIYCGDTERALEKEEYNDFPCLLFSSRLNTSALLLH